MKSFSIAAFCAVLALAGQAVAGERPIVKSDAAERFATLPTDVRFPEGIAANPDNGDIYVGTFDFGGPNEILRFSRKGQLIATRSGFPPLLGLEFNPRDNKLYFANLANLAGLGGAKIQRIAANLLGDITDVATIPSIGAPGARTVGNPDGSSDTITFGNNTPAPNALVFETDGDLLVSDSFQGAIFRIPACPTAPCVAVEVVQDPLLATAGFPPFGANGLALSDDGATLFVANTGDDRILKVDLAATVPTVSVFAESINGADGIAFDDRGRLWVAANQGDHLVALNENGRVVAQLGAFLGIKNGAAKGLLFPASIVIVGDNIFVTNLALPLGTSGDEPEAEVTRYTVSRVKIPDGEDGEDDD